MSADTIAAIATPIGEGGISVIRVSGVDSIAVVDQLFRGSTPLVEVATHTVNYGKIVDPNHGRVLDESLILVMKAPRSFTAEDVVEIQCHGGLQITRSILSCLLRNGARLAEPGEFSKRAFLNGRLDLMQAESISDLIRAKSDRAQEAALKQLKGNGSDQIRKVRKKLVSLMAHVEVNIDYPEHDVESMTYHEIIRVCRDVIEELNRWLNNARQGTMIREGVRTVLVGKPNVGKSSLMNRFAREERAIVTDIPGTTRDVIEEWIHIGGYALRLFDTAGLRETNDLVEQIGVARSKEAIEKSDLVLFVLNNNDVLNDEEISLAHEIAGRPVLVILNKSDLPQKLDTLLLKNILPESPLVAVSALDGSGFSILESELINLIGAGQIEADDSVILNRLRHLELTEQAKQFLLDAIHAVDAQIPIDLIQIDLRQSWETLGLLIGETSSETLLDELFSQFCLGK